MSIIDEFDKYGGNVSTQLIAAIKYKRYAIVPIASLIIFCGHAVFEASVNEVGIGGLVGWVLCFTVIVTLCSYNRYTNYMTACFLIFEIKKPPVSWRMTGKSKARIAIFLGKFWFRHAG